MILPEPPFAGLTSKQLQIVKKYEYLRFQPDGTPVVRRVAVELNRKLDCNNGNSYIYRVIKKWNNLKREYEAARKSSPV